MKMDQTFIKSLFICARYFVQDFTYLNNIEPYVWMIFYAYFREKCIKIQKERLDRFTKVSGLQVEDFNLDNMILNPGIKIISTSSNILN